MHNSCMIKKQPNSNKTIKKIKPEEKVKAVAAAPVVEEDYLPEDDLKMLEEIEEVEQHHEEEFAEIEDVF